MTNSLQERKRLLAEYALLQEEKERRLKLKSLMLYTPHPKQKIFHLSPAQIRLLVTGNRFGKTESSFVDLHWDLTGEYPDWYPDKLKVRHSIKARWCCPDFEKGVGEVFQEKVDKYMPWHLVKDTQKNSRGFIVKYYYHSGSTLDIVTYEQDLLSYEGVSRDRVHFDEPPPRDKFVASLRACVDRGGRISMSLTPISEPWIFDDLYLSEDKDIEIITGTIYDNPHLTEAYIKQYEKLLTPEEKEARIFGKFLTLMGLVYKQLNRATHGRDRFEIPQNWLRIFVLDPHDRRPHYCGWFAVSPTNDVFFYRFAKIDGDYLETVRQIKEIEKGEEIYYRIIDPNFGQKIYKNTGRTVREEFTLAGRDADYEMRFKLADDDIAAGHLKVRQYIAYDPKRPIGIDNTPKFFIFQDMLEVWHDMQRYIYDEWKANKSEKTPKEAPRDIFKDVPDLVRYCLMDNPTHTEPEVYIPEQVASYV